MAFILIFCLSAILFIGFDYFVIGNQYNENYQASLIDKVERLESINEPKIILVGNSNVALGMQSNLIEEAFEMPVVNLGLHGFMGNAFHENIAKLNINKDDIVVICHSDYSDGDGLNRELACITLEWNTELWKILRWEDIPNVLAGYPKYVLKAANLWITKTGNQPEQTCYTRGAFNKYGDIECERDVNEYVFTDESVNVPKVGNECVARLNALNSYVQEQGATMVIAGYPIADGEFTPDKSEYQLFQQELEDKMDAAVISDYTDYFYPYSYFYDSNLHLTNQGTRARTEQLIEDLRDYFK